MCLKNMYLLDPKNRLFSNLYLPNSFGRYLSKWVGNATFLIFQEPLLFV